MKITLSDVTNIGGNPASAATSINDNNALLEAALDNTLSRDGTSPNEMLANLDMNHFDLLNVQTTNTDNLVLNGVPIFVQTDLTTANVVNIEEKEYTANGIQTTFALTNTPIADENVLVYVGGAIQASDQYSISGSNIVISPAPANGLQVLLRNFTMVTYNELKLLRDETIAAAASVVGLAGFTIVATTPDISGLDENAVTAAIAKDTGFLWIYRLGDYDARVSADTDGNNFRVATGVLPSIGAWVRVQTTTPASVQARVFEFKDYRGSYGTDQTAAEALIRDAFLLANTANESATIDFNGMALTLTQPLNIATITGQTTNGAVIFFQNGSFVPTAGAAWNSVTVTKDPCGWTAYSDVVTVPDTTGLKVGMVHIKTLSSGFCRYSHIIEIIDATSVRMSCNNWLTGTGSVSFVDDQYVFDFRDMTSSGNKRFMNMKAELGGNCSFLRMPSNGNNWIYFNLQVLGVKDVFINNWHTAGGGSITALCEARPFDSNPATRTAVGLIVSDNDNKFLNNRIINFLHSQVMHGSGYTIVGCHNWQGAGDDPSVRSSSYLHTAPAAFCTYTGNYIDNGGIEFSSENSGSAPTSFRSITVTGNVFTFSENAQEGSYCIELRPVVSGGGNMNINGMTVCHNVFRKLGASISKIENVAGALGGIDPNGATDFVWTDNTYVSITKKSNSRPKTIVTVAQADAATVWTQSGTTIRDTYYPFLLRTQRVNSVVPGQKDGIMAAGGTTFTYQPWFTTIDAANPYTIRLRWAASVHGTALTELDCSN